MNQDHIDAGISIDIPGLVAIGAQSKFSHTQLLRNAKAVLAGAHLSSFRGRGMDFAESREYLPGDDRRHIDWRVTARTGKPHTKLYIEEKERPVFLLVEMGSSMFFGTQGGFKSVTAARLAAYLAWSTVGAGDRVGGIIGRTGEFTDLRPASGRRGALRMVNALSASTVFNPDSVESSGSMLTPLLEQAGRLVHPGSQVFIISDFYDVNEVTHQLTSRLTRHNDLMFCQIIDQLELVPPEPGRYRFTNGIESCTVGLQSQRRRQEYQNVFAEKESKLRDLSKRFAIPLVSMSAGDTFSDVFSVNSTTRGVQRAGFPV
ncbi:MAG: DUF58 domain-containing protein [Acidiferrobacterales bacterium]|nr:DUF58 domain-containing protein [Acidiferrobacterales bacterium]